MRKESIVSLVKLSFQKERFLVNVFTEGKEVV